MGKRLFNAVYKVPGVHCEFELFIEDSTWYLVFGGIVQDNDQFTNYQIQAIDDYVRERLTPDGY